MERTKPKAKKKRSFLPIHRNLARLRAGLALSQTEFGKLLGRDKTMISHWEGGWLIPTTKELPKIAQKLGVTTDELLGAS